MSCDNKLELIWMDSPGHMTCLVTAITYFLSPCISVLQLLFLLIVFQITDPCPQVKDKKTTVPVQAVKAHISCLSQLC